MKIFVKLEHVINILCAPYTHTHTHTHTLDYGGTRMY